MWLRLPFGTSLKRKQKTWLYSLLLALPFIPTLISWLGREIRQHFRHPERKPGYRIHSQYEGYELVGSIDPASEDFLRAVESITLSPVTRGNHLELLLNGDEIFPAMLEAIHSAKSSVNFLTFVYWTGEIAPEFAKAITARAKAGVTCNVLLDALGADKIDRNLVKQMQAAGASVVWFRPPRWYNLNKVDNRTHRKILVVDGCIGFTGGVGIAKEWTGNAQDLHHWRDTHVKVEGPAVRGLQGAFSENWLEATGEVLVGDKYLPDLQGWPEEGVAAQVTRSSAGKADSNAETLFFLAIAATRKRLWLTTAYFVPGPLFRQALVACAKRGVDLRVLVPGPHDNKILVREAGRKTYRQLIKAGVKVYEYQPTMLHAKTMVVDSIWSSIGSTNFDNRSFALNEEANISVHDPRIAAELETHFLQDQALAKEIKEVGWSLVDILEWPAEVLSSLFDREI